MFEMKNALIKDKTPMMKLSIMIVATTLLVLMPIAFKMPNSLFLWFIVILMIETIPKSPIANATKEMIYEDFLMILNWL